VQRRFRRDPCSDSRNRSYRSAHHDWPANRFLQLVGGNFFIDLHVDSLSQRHQRRARRFTALRQTARRKPFGRRAKIWSTPSPSTMRTSTAGSGNRGRIYVILGSNQYTDLVEASANQVTAFAPAPNGGLYAATSNLGKVFLLGPNAVNEGTYESDVFDAKNFSRWGRPRSAATATSRCWRVAVTSTIPTATGVRGRKSICRRTCRSMLRRRGLSSGKRCCSRQPHACDRQRHH